MLSQDDIMEALPHALAGVDLPGLGPKLRGKVRDIYRRDGQRILITTDRLSAFDRVLGLVPYKGQVLNQLSAFWFEATRHIMPNHVLSVPDSNVTIARECRPYPVEVIVRGYITGVTTTSLWYHYERGARELYGLCLPDGLRKNDPLPRPIITPTTKAESGHDERLTRDEIIARGLVPADTWEQIEAAALALFAYGQEVARRAGLILVDTKYEFGAWEGQPMLIDEVHTPDSSRFWRAESYAERLAAGLEPENFDKEFIRLWYAERGYRGDGDPPPWPTELAVQASLRYIRVYEMLTGQTFVPGAYPAGPRIQAALEEVLR
ncbi:MAG: phosphoribosylaminoimidazolesuccinocarboxamide synthase [Chloroflexota bacterium]